jgi:hypothetical protein
MSMWLFVLVATALGGAVALWHAVSRAKHLSEGMLDEYSQMLAQARKEKAEQLAKEGEEDGGEPSEVR